MEEKENNESSQSRKKKRMWMATTLLLPVSSYLLLFVFRLESLPRQFPCEEVDEHVADALQVVATTLERENKQTTSAPV